MNATGGGDPTAAETESRYDVGVELSPQTSQGLAVQLIGHAQHVLEIGAAGGLVTKALIGNGCSLVAVEPDPEATERLERTGATVVTEPIETVLADPSILGDSGFDAILCGDVLEHLVDPVDVLRRLLNVLKPSGFVVISVPNVAHIDVRLALLNGRFPYTETGLLDRTHLRFFTRESVGTLLDECGLVPIDIERTHADPFCTELGLAPEDFDPDLVRRLRDEPEAETYQFVIKAVRRSADTEVARALDERLQMAYELHDARQRVAHLEPQAKRLIEVQADLDIYIATQEQLLARTSEATRTAAEYEARLRRLAPIEKAIMRPWLLTLGRRVRNGFGRPAS